MHTPQLTIRPIQYGSLEYTREVELRRRVLRIPLGREIQPEQLAAEDTDVHIGAFAGDALAGCIILTRVSPEVVKMRQFAVEPAAQRQGIGKRIVAWCEAYCRAQGYREIQLHARDLAVPFYTALGYEGMGEPFIEVTIPHLAMRKIIR